eukprot:COSAG04_NODE_3106_length_3161_cov_2.430764_1_plen_132_part_00
MSILHDGSGKLSAASLVVRWQMLLLMPYGRVCTGDGFEGRTVAAKNAGTLNSFGYPISSWLKSTVCRSSASVRRRLVSTMRRLRQPEREKAPRKMCVAPLPELEFCGRLPDRFPDQVINLIVAASLKNTNG